MREREQVGEMATANGCGRHVAFACPDESPNGAAWVWFVPHAGWIGWEASIRRVIVAGGSYWWSQLPFAVFFLTAAVASVAVLALPRYQRRAGGPAPRLYCFEDGVVVATGRVLRPFGRQEISIGSVTWRGHEDVGTRRTLKDLTAASSSCSPGVGCGDWRIERLHKAAVEGGGADGGGHLTVRHMACPDGLLPSGPYGIARTDGERISAAIQLSGRSVAILRTNGNNISTRSLAGLRQIGVCRHSRAPATTAGVNRRVARGQLHQGSTRHARGVGPVGA